MTVFPEAARVVYANNPLNRVICQLRFPTILKIEVEAPAEFQERVRSLFPVYRTRNLTAVPENLPNDLTQQLGIPQHLAHDFETEDGLSAFTLAQNFVALTTRRYDRWEEFSESLHAPLEALREVYSPAYFSRIGLRYENVIQRDVAGESASWSELIAPQVLGELGDPTLSAAIESVSHEIHIRLDDACRIRLVHGLASKEGEPERAYLIDSDFYRISKTEVGDARSVLDSLNRESGRLFNWCITPKLHAALGPSPA